MYKKELQVDPMNKVFAKVMKICTWAGLIVMIVFGLLYIIGINSYIDVSTVAKYWGEPAASFWRKAKDIEINGYWFLSHPGFMDSLSMLGVCLLALAPLISVIAIIPNSKKIYMIFLSILTAEFIFSIIRPIIF